MEVYTDNPDNNVGDYFPMCATVETRNNGATSFYSESCHKSRGIHKDRLAALYYGFVLSGCSKALATHRDETTGVDRSMHRTE